MSCAGHVKGIKLLSQSKGKTETLSVISDNPTLALDKVTIRQIYNHDIGPVHILISTRLTPSETVSFVSPRPSWFA